MVKRARIAVVGATGMVGQEMRKLLVEKHFPIEEFIPVASEKSKGQSIEFAGKQYTLKGMSEALEAKPDIALFSAGGSVSKEWAKRFTDQGTVVIDNSSAWRMDPEIPLVVPEVNANQLSKNKLLIANPNCSTIQLVMVLKPLVEKFGIERVIVSTYQSVTGTGYKAVAQMEAERRGGTEVEQVYPHPIDLNLIPHCDVFEADDYTKEELKLLYESRKILGIPDLRLTATSVRVPVTGGHSESVNIELQKDFDLREVRELLSVTEGVVLLDDPKKNSYPMPLSAKGRDEVFVGRIRRDLSHTKALNLFIVADNLRKGAATNAVQIAEKMWALIAVQDNLELNK
jgi:aspartate-semialdehyde dehydrogenase